MEDFSKQTIYNRRKKKQIMAKKKIEDTAVTTAKKTVTTKTTKTVKTPVEKKKEVKEVASEVTETITPEITEVPTPEIIEESQEDIMKTSLPNMEVKLDAEIDAAVSGLQPNLLHDTKVKESTIQQINAYNTIQFKAARPAKGTPKHKPIKFNGYTWNGSFVD